MCDVDGRASMQLHIHFHGHPSAGDANPRWHIPQAFRRQSGVQYHTGSASHSRFGTDGLALQQAPAETRSQMP